MPEKLAMANSVKVIAEQPLNFASKVMDSSVDQTFVPPLSLPIAFFRACTFIVIGEKTFSFAAKVTEMRKVSSPLSVEYERKVLMNISQLLTFECIPNGKSFRKRLRLNFLDLYLSVFLVFCFATFSLKPCTPGTFNR